MDSQDTERALLNSLSSIDHRNWESLEKNNKGAELVKRIREASIKKDAAELTKLVVEMKQFMSSDFTLFERMKRITRDEAGRSWSKPQDTEVWKNYMQRAVLVVERRDKDELLELAQKIAAFLRRRNGHILAKSIEEALKLAARRP